MERVRKTEIEGSREIGIPGFGIFVCYSLMDWNK
jgi:hypothetical protein